VSWAQGSMGLEKLLVPKRVFSRPMEPCAHSTTRCLSRSSRTAPVAAPPAFQWAPIAAHSRPARTNPHPVGANPRSGSARVPRELAPARTPRSRGAVPGARGHMGLEQFVWEPRIYRDPCGLTPYATTPHNPTHPHPTPPPTHPIPPPLTARELALRASRHHPRVTLAPAPCTVVFTREPAERRPIWKTF
jgi:hypothetical protein